MTEVAIVLQDSGVDTHNQEENAMAMSNGSDLGIRTESLFADVNFLRPDREDAEGDARGAER